MEKSQATKKTLTERQEGVVNAIRTWIQEHGFPPTIRELGQRLGIKSLRGVTTHLDAIVKKGYLQRTRGARSLRLLIEHSASAIEESIRIPIVGRIAAGTPFLAEENPEGHLAIDTKIFGKTPPAAKHFALRVQGMSMQGAGILDGDYVIVRQAPNAENGDIVVVLLGDEATVKRFFKENDHIRLQPEHPTMEPVILNKQHAIEILGKVIAVFRKLA